MLALSVELFAGWLCPQQSVCSRDALSHAGLWLAHVWVSGNDHLSSKIKCGLLFSRPDINWKRGMKKEKKWVIDVTFYYMIDFQQHTQVMYFCFDFLKYIASEEFSIHGKPRRYAWANLISFIALGLSLYTRPLCTSLRPQLVHQGAYSLRPQLVHTQAPIALGLSLYTHRLL